MSFKKVILKRDNKDIDSYLMAINRKDKVKIDEYGRRAKEGEVIRII